MRNLRVPTAFTHISYFFLCWVENWRLSYHLSRWCAFKMTTEQTLNFRRLRFPVFFFFNVGRSAEGTENASEAKVIAPFPSASTSQLWHIFQSLSLHHSELTSTNINTTVLLTDFMKDVNITARVCLKSQSFPP